MATNIFQDSTKTVPKSDPMIRRVSGDQVDIGGRTSHLPGKSPKSPDMTIRHVGSDYGGAAGQK